MKTAKNKRRGFTIIELLVVIGIIALLASIAVPMILRAARAGQRTRQAADLNSIATALEMYKQDFGDYPRPLAGDGTGFAVLTKALMGPYGTDPANAPTLPDQGAAGSVQNSAGQQVSVGPDVSGNPTWRPFTYTDGAVGPGFRVGPNVVDSNSDGVPDRPGGKVYGPYIEPGKFKLRGLAMLDLAGNPIMYFPANSKKINLNLPTATYVDRTAANPMYNFDDNGVLAASMVPERGTASAYPSALARFQAMLGDNSSITPDGKISGSEKAATTGPYILWSAGADGLFGPREGLANMSGPSDLGSAISKCDDVLHFTPP